MGSVTTTNICKCCGDCITATLKCATRGATLTLVGYPEFVVSTPPRMYRHKAFSSTLINCDGPPHTPPTCASVSGVGRSDVGGFCQVNATTGVESNNTTSNIKNVITISCVDPGIGASGGTIACSTVPVGKDIALSSALDPTILTATTLRGVSRSDCYPAGGTSGNDRKWIGGGFYNIDLSDEDLESDAIVRFQGSTSYSGFAVCTAPSCCTAKYEQRTTSITFGYADAQWRVFQTSLTAGQLYYAHVPIYRRPYGTSPTWTLYQTLVTSGTTSVTGVLSIDGQVPNDVGFESYADQPCVVVPKH